MNGKYICRVLFSLFLLLPCASLAQGIVQCEYWFDGNYANKVENKMNGGETINIVSKVPTEQLVDGIHQFNFRVMQSDGKYSPVLSRVFFKSTASNSAILEYWFDDNYDKRVSKELASADGEGNVAMNLDLSDNTKFPMGNHRLHLRVTNNHGISAVYTSSVLKLQSGKIELLEYWFDDTYDKRASKELAAADEEGNVAMNLDLSDNTKFPMGNHRLHLRVTNSHGISAVYTSSVVKLMSGKINLLEYWFDDDNSNALHIDGKTTDGNTVFQEQVDLSDVSEGVHRLYYRGVSANGVSSTAISSTPIIVKPRYAGDPSTAVITSYNVVFDNGTAEHYDVENAMAEKTILLNLDTRSLKKGTHSVRTTIWNSFGATTSLSSNFEVVTPPNPSLTLTATESGGRVALNFYGVPGDMQYKIYREDANGVNVLVKNVDPLYPYGMTVFDEPGNGSFKYQIKCKYQDFSQKIQMLESPKASVTIGTSDPETPEPVTPEPTITLGYVTGCLVGGGEIPEIMSFIRPESGIIVEATDGVTTTSRSVTNGYFCTEKYPIGTTLTLTVKGTQQYRFEPIQVVVAPTPRKVPIKGELVREVENNTNRYELNLASDLSWYDTYISFYVENRSWKPWKGKVGFKAITEKAHNAALGIGVTSMDLLYSPDVNERLWFTSFTEDEITIEGKSKKQVLIPLSEVFPDNKSDYYYLYFLTEGRPSDAAEETKQQKELYVDYYTYNATNPLKRQLDKSTLESAKDMVLAQEAEYAVNLILNICNKIESVDKYLGIAQNGLYDIGNQSSKFYDTQKTDGIFSLIENNGYDPGALMSLDEGRVLLQAEVGLFGSNEIRKFREHVVNSVLKGNKTVKKYLEGAMKVLKSMNDLTKSAQEFRNKTEYEKTFYMAKKILSWSGVEETEPFGTILSTYIDVTESFANAALSLGKKYYDYSSAALMYENRPEPKDQEDYPYNRHIDFKIKVDYGGFWGNFTGFNGSEIARQISDVEVYVTNRPNAPDQVARVTFEPVPVSDGVMLRQVTFDNGAPLGQGSLDIGVPFERMWMAIKWKNGRVSTVPLLDKGSVKFDQPNFIFGRKTYQYTVTFQSKAGYNHADNMADILQLKD